MDNILPENEYTEVEGRVYTNPQVGIDETNTFIDNLRSTQGQQNQEIMTDTQRLGTDIPSVQGGLLGPESYFISRYQTPQTNAVVANLRATAQAAALNDVLANEQAIWKEKYQQAYRNYQKRMRNKGYGGNGGGGTAPEDANDNIEGGVEEEDTTSRVAHQENGTLRGIPGTQNVVDLAGNMQVVNSNGDWVTVFPSSEQSNSGNSLNNTGRLQWGGVIRTGGGGR